MNTCPHCGNSPVPHTFTRLTTTVNARMNPLVSRVSARMLPQLTTRLAHFSFIFFLRVTLAVGAARYSEDPEDALSPRGKVLWLEAKRRGLHVRGIKMLGQKTEAYHARVGSRNIFFTALPRPLTTASGTDWWIDDKALFKQRLLSAGLPVARGGAFTNFRTMRAAFETLQKPVIVKPRLGSRGRHTTTYIYTEAHLREAFATARAICGDVIMEEQFFGSVYRATVVDGTLIGILRGDPPRVVGDGTRTIADLVAVQNSQRHPRVAAIELGPEHAVFLARTGRSFDTVLAPGECVDVLGKVGLSYGGLSSNDTAITHPKIVEFAHSVARALEDPIVGLDFIVPDITRDPSEQRWGFIECNTAPFINLHHDPVEGDPVNAAAVVWEYVERNAARF